MPAFVVWALFVAYYFHFGALDSAAYYEWRAHAAVDVLPGLVGLPLGLALRPLQKNAATQRFGVEGPHCVAGLIAVPACLVLAFAKPLINPMPQSHITDTWRDDVCLQSTHATCGPCAAATVLRALGIEAGEKELAAAASSTQSGTLNWLLVRHLRERGLRAEFKEPATLNDVTAPAIVGVRVTSFGHFIAYLGKAPDGRYIIGEPLHGRIVVDDRALARRYDFDHFAIEIGR